MLPLFCGSGSHICSVWVVFSYIFSLYQTIWAIKPDESNIINCSFSKNVIFRLLFHISGFTGLSEVFWGHCILTLLLHRSEWWKETSQRLSAEDLPHRPLQNSSSGTRTDAERGVKGTDASGRSNQINNTHKHRSERAACGLPFIEPQTHYWWCILHVLRERNKGVAPCISAWSDKLRCCGFVF